MDKTPEKRTATGYFFIILTVLGGAFFMPSFTVFFTTISPFLLLFLTPVVLIGFVQHRQQLCLLAQHSKMLYHSQEPVAVSQSSTNSDICDSAPWR